MKDFSKLPAYGIWENKPQTDLEKQEELEKIKNLGEIHYLNESDYSYVLVIGDK